VGKEPHTWETRQAHWAEADTAGRQHGDMCRGQEPVEGGVFEVKKKKPKK